MHVLHQVGVVLVVVMVGVLFASVQKGSFYFSPGFLTCRLSHKLLSKTAVLLLAGGFVLPSLLLVLLINLRILIRSTTKLILNVRQRDNTRTMCAVSVLFVVCCAPATILNMYQVSHSVPAWIETLTFEIFHVTTFANPLLYLTLNGGFRHFIANGVPEAKSCRDRRISVNLRHSIDFQSTAHVLKAVPTL